MKSMLPRVSSLTVLCWALIVALAGCQTPPVPAPTPYVPAKYAPSSEVRNFHNYPRFVGGNTMVITGGGDAGAKYWTGVLTTSFVWGTCALSIFIGAPMALLCDACESGKNPKKRPVPSLLFRIVYLMVLVWALVGCALTFMGNARSTNGVYLAADTTQELSVSVLLAAVGLMKNSVGLTEQALLLMENLRGVCLPIQGQVLPLVEQITAEMQIISKENTGLIRDIGTNAKQLQDVSDAFREAGDLQSSGNLTMLVLFVFLVAMCVVNAFLSFFSRNKTRDLNKYDIIAQTMGWVLKPACWLLLTIALCMAAVQIVLLTATADFCMDPEYNTLQAVSESVTNENRLLFSYYLTCSGSSSLQTKLLAAEASRLRAQKLLAAQAAQLTLQCPAGASLLVKLTHVLQVQFATVLTEGNALVQCLRINKLYKTFVEEATCNDVVSGLGLLFIGLLMYSFCVFICWMYYSSLRGNLVDPTPTEEIIHRRTIIIKQAGAVLPPLEGDAVVPPPAPAVTVVAPPPVSHTYNTTNHYYYGNNEATTTNTTSSTQSNPTTPSGAITGGGGEMIKSGRPSLSGHSSAIGMTSFANNQAVPVLPPLQHHETGRGGELVLPPSSYSSSSSSNNNNHHYNSKLGLLGMALDGVVSRDEQEAHLRSAQAYARPRASISEAVTPKGSGSNTPLLGNRRFSVPSNIAAETDFLLAGLGGGRGGGGGGQWQERDNPDHIFLQDTPNTPGKPQNQTTSSSSPSPSAGLRSISNYAFLDGPKQTYFSDSPGGSGQNDGFWRDEVVPAPPLRHHLAMDRQLAPQQQLLQRNTTNTTDVTTSNSTSLNTSNSGVTPAGNLQIGGGTIKVNVKVNITKKDKGEKKKLTARKRLVEKEKETEQRERGGGGGGMPYAVFRGADGDPADDVEAEE